MSRIAIISNTFTPTDGFRSIENNEWKSPLKLLSVENVKNIFTSEDL